MPNSLSIVTATYNRRTHIEKLYNSLKSQDNKDFEWVIIDDGSSDDTQSLVEGWILEDEVKIIYHKQPNQGKHIAFNTSFDFVSGRYYFMVDSDDFLASDAVSTVLNSVNLIEGRLEVCGIFYNRLDLEGNPIGDLPPTDNFTSSIVNFKNRYSGDRVEVFKTEILKKFKFPKFEGEKFSPEALIMFRMSQKYKILYLNKGFYFCEYQTGGLTDNITKIRMKSPRGTTLYYYEHFLRSHTLPMKMKSAINFYRFCANDKTIEDKIPFPYKFLKFFGNLMYSRDVKNISK